jgi:hypothetical protein
MDHRCHLNDQILLQGREGRPIHDIGAKAQRLVHRALVAVIDSGLGKVFLLDCTFEVLDEYETDTSYCSIYMDDEARNIYCFTQEGVKMEKKGESMTVTRNRSLKKKKDETIMAWVLNGVFGKINMCL